MDTLEQVLTNTTARRQDRLTAAQYVLRAPGSMAPLLDYCFNCNTPLSYRAAWVLEFVCLKDLALLYPYLNPFFESLPAVTAHQLVRPLAHLCELLARTYYQEKDASLREAFTEAHKNVMTQCCFDWLLTPQKVACQVRAMTALYYLGTEFSWIHPELAALLKSEMPKGSAGYKARGKKVLDKIATGKF